MKLGVVCQSCGLEAPTRHVLFHQNIGALIWRYHKKADANLCKRCIHQKFWSMTAITAAIGWVGITSVILAPFYIVNNVIRYIGALRMPSVPSGARQPQINEEIFSRFLHRADEFFQRVQSGEDADDVARAIGAEIGATPGQVLKCMITLMQHRQMQHDLEEKNRADSSAIHRQPDVAAREPLPI